MSVVISTLRVLVAQKELREGRKLSIRTIAAESGATVTAVQRLLNNTIREVPLDALAALCDWVPCEVGEMLHLQSDESEAADS